MNERERKKCALAECQAYPGTSGYCSLDHELKAQETPPPRTDYRGERCPVESNGFLCTLTYRHPLACDFGPLYKPPAPPRDPLVEVAEKIASAIVRDRGWTAPATILPILRAFVEEVREPLLYTSDKQTVAWKERALKAEASLDEERRLRATACTLADEEKAKLNGWIDAFARVEHERDTARAEAADLKREVERLERENADNVKNGYQTIGGMAQRLRDKDTAFWRMKTRLIRTARRILRQRITAEAERDRAQEKLREAEGLLEQIALELQSSAGTLATLDTEGSYRGMRAWMLMAEARIRAFLAHPDEQPAAPDGEPLPTDLDRACPDHPFAMLRYCACGTATTERLKAKVRAVGGAEAYRRICNFVNEPDPPAPRTEAPASVRETAQRLGVTLTESREEIDRATAKRIAPEPSERHAFVASKWSSRVGNHWETVCAVMTCGKPESDPVHAEQQHAYFEDVQEPRQLGHCDYTLPNGDYCGKVEADPVHHSRDINIPCTDRTCPVYPFIHSPDPVHQAAEPERRRYTYPGQPPDTRPDEREAEPCNACISHGPLGVGCIPCVLPKGHEQHAPAPSPSPSEEECCKLYVECRHSPEDDQFAVALAHIRAQDALLTDALGLILHIHAASISGSDTTAGRRETWIGWQGDEAVMDTQELKKAARDFLLRHAKYAQWQP